MERRAFLATILIILILLIWQYFFLPGPPSPPKSAEEPPPPPPQPTVAKTVVPPPRDLVPTERLKLPEKDVVVETPLMRMVLSTRGGVVKSWQLKRYRLKGGEPVELIPPNGHSTTSLATWIKPGEPVLPVYQVDKEQLTLSSPQEEESLTFTYMAPSGLQLKKTLSFRGDDYEVRGRVEVRNMGGEELSITSQLTWGPGFREGERRRTNRLFPPTIWVDGKKVTEKVEKLQGVATYAGVAWAALHDTYFAAALIPLDGKSGAFVTKDHEGKPVIGLLEEPLKLPPGGEARMSFAVYAGPKELDRLKALGHDLDRLVDFGWFDFLAKPALAFLKFVYRYTRNYGIAIIILTILIKVFFHPLTHKSLKAMQAMQALQPKIAALRERYKNNPQRLNQETMQLYKRYGVNPLGGCLPMLFQIPVFIALYNALSSAIELWRAPLDGYWIKDLSAADQYHILPILMGVSMFIQQKMSPSAGDPRQARLMLYFMPVFLTIIFWSFPSGLVLYWLVNNLLQIGEQTLIMRRLAHPPVGRRKSG